MEKKIIFFDIDGTLFDHKTGRVLPSTIEALKKLKKDPFVEVCVATGRSIYELHTIENIKEYFDTFITINGQVVYHNNEIVYENKISTKDIEMMKNYFDENNMIYGLVGKSRQSISDTNDFVKWCFDNVRMTLPNIDPLLYKEEEIFMIWSFATDEEIEIMKDKFLDYSFISWKVNGCDIIPKGKSKSDSMLWYVNKMGYDIKNVYAFGDGDNDIEMIKDAGVGIAMGNATEDTKKVADYITCDSASDGIYHALKHFELI